MLLAALMLFEVSVSDKMSFVLDVSKHQRRFHLQTKAASCHPLTEEETPTFSFDTYKQI